MSAGVAVSAVTSLDTDDLAAAMPNPAMRTAEVLLVGVGTRLAHSRRVALQAQVVRHLLDAPWSDALVDAAWLHDIGYNDDLAVTGFHPLDGARWLREEGWPEEVCRLVAWHTEALVGAKLSGLDAALMAEFAPPPTRARSALTWADLTSSPAGEHWSAESRIADILCRYPEGSLVHQATVTSLPNLRRAVGRVERAMASPGSPPAALATGDGIAARVTSLNEEIA